MNGLLALKYLKKLRPAYHHNYLKILDLSAFSKKVHFDIKPRLNLFPTANDSYVQTILRSFRFSSDFY